MPDRLFHLAGFVAASLLLCATPVFSQLTSMTPAQKEVWSGELRYCDALMKHDLEAYMSLWDETFIGWPGMLAAPTNKAGIRQDVSKSIAEDMQCTSTPMAINVFGDFANTYYLIRTTRTDAGGKTTAGAARITHTWRRSDGAWKIVGGMGARVEQQSAAKTAPPTIVGVWTANAHDLPAIKLTVNNDSGKLSGNIIFYFLQLENGTWKNKGGSPTELIAPHMEGNFFVFRVPHAKRHGSTDPADQEIKTFRLDVVGPDEAVFHNAMQGHDLELRREK